MQPIATLLLVICTGFSGSVLAQHRMYGGVDVPVSEYPFVVAIAYGPDLVGNGAIMSDKWILSSASTFYNTGDDNYRAHVGGDDFGGGQRYEAERVFRHSEFIGWDFNVALMRLKRTIEFGPNARPIALAASDPDSIDITLLSYGRNEDGTKHLRSGEYSLASDNNCISKLNEPEAKEMIGTRHGYCMYPSPGTMKGQWQDDAGAPAVSNNELVGVFALSEHEGGYTDVSIVTRTATFKDWIGTTMSRTT